MTKETLDYRNKLIELLMEKFEGLVDVTHLPDSPDGIYVDIDSEILASNSEVIKNNPEELPHMILDLAKEQLDTINPKNIHLCEASIAYLDSGLTSTISGLVVS